MTETYSFERLGALIQTLATQGFFRKDDQEKLNQRFPDPGLTAVYLRTQPYKFGIYWMMLDRNRNRSGQYHLALESRAAFELLKRLVDLLPTLALAEKDYLRKLLRAGISDDNKDLASVITEINAYVALKKHVDTAQIGDGERLPDIQLTEASRTYDIQCKSVGLSDIEVAEVAGMCEIIKAAGACIPNLMKAQAFFAWHIKPGHLADPAVVKKASAAIRLSVDMAMQGGTFLPERSPYMDLIKYSRSTNTTFDRFLNQVMPDPSWDRVIPVVTELLADWSQVPLSHGFVFCSVRDINKLVERATKSFCKAMDQHKRMNSSWPLVYLNLESPSVMTGHVPTEHKGDKSSDYPLKSATACQAAIFRNIEATPAWAECKGVILDV